MAFPERSRRHPARVDAGVSETLGTILLTAMTLVLATGFGLVVFSSVTGSETPSPTGSFSVEARSGADHVTVSFREGTSFELSHARLALTLEPGTLAAGYVTGPLVEGRFSPGDTMRFNLTSGVVASGARLSFYAVDADTGDVIGHAAASVPDGTSVTVFSSAAVTSGTITMTPATLIADGSNVTTLRVALSSTHGLALTRSVTADLSAVGGGKLVLVDDGTRGDAVANDGIYSGQFAASSTSLAGGAPTGTASIPIEVTDIFGKTTSGGSGSLGLTSAGAGSIDLAALNAQIASAIHNATSATNILGVGGISRNIPNSTALHELTITNFTWRDVTRLNNDVILYRITDMTNTTNSWAAALYFDTCALSQGGGPYGAVKEIVFTRDGVAGTAVWRPTTPTDCWTVDYDTRLNLANLNASVNATGASPPWTVSSRTISGSLLTVDPTIYSYRSAGIGSINQGIVPYFSDTQPTANPHGSLDDLGLGTAQVEWKRYVEPLASFTTSTSGLTVLVNAAGTTDPQGSPIVSYEWGWGDGGPSTTGVTSSRTYATGGNYTVTLTATNDLGISGVATSVVSLNRPPTAVASATATGLRTVSASALGSIDPDGQALTYTWMWGDGSKTTTSALTATKTYSTAAFYTITLFANDTAGGSATATTSIGHAPTASFTWTRGGLTVATDASASTHPTGSGLSYSWSWGDGSAATTGVTSLRTYAGNATHTVTLTVTSTFGVAATSATSILHDGNGWLDCPALTMTHGSVSDCSDMRSSTDSLAAMRLTETNAASVRQLMMTFGLTGFPEAGKAHTLQARAGLVSGTAEALALQVLDPGTGVWSTHATWSGAMTTSTATAMTNAQWNNGSPTFRFVDANCVTGTCGGSDGSVTAWDVDWVRVVSS